MVRKSRVVVPALLGLALSISALAGPPAQAAPVLTPAVAPAVLPLVSPLPVDTGAKLTVNPVAYGGSVVADFSKGQTVKKRPVMLQAQRPDGSWTNVVAKALKMDSKGVVVFKLGIGDTTIYRAVAGRYKKKKSEVVTPSRWSAWKLDKSYDFNGTNLDADWASRNEGSFAAYGRNCAAPFASNVAVSGGYVHLKLTNGNRADIAAARAAGCVTSKYKVYRNAMISTDGAYSISKGIMAAKVKFPRTRGLHNGVWLRSRNSEIDMVEAYGYPKGRGVTHAWHGYSPTRVIKEHKRIGNKSKKWWSQAHIYSVEWNSQRVTYRIDGAITKSVSRGSAYKPLGGESYFLVISSLTSEFDQRAHKVTASELGSTTTSVDWVKAWANK